MHVSQRLKVQSKPRLLQTVQSNACSEDAKQWGGCTMKDMWVYMSGRNISDVQREEEEEKEKRKEKKERERREMSAVGGMGCFGGSGRSGVFFGAVGEVE